MDNQKKIDAAYAEMERCAEAGDVKGYMAAKREYSIESMKITDFTPKMKRQEAVVLPVGISV